MGRPTTPLDGDQVTRQEIKRLNACARALRAFRRLFAHTGRKATERGDGNVALSATKKGEVVVMSDAELEFPIFPECVAKGSRLTLGVWG